MWLIIITIWLITCVVCGKYIASIFIPSLDKYEYGRLERAIYRVLCINHAQTQHWYSYLLSMVLFNIISLLAIFLIALLQYYVTTNINHKLTVDLAFNIAASYVTGTNWQAYENDVQISHFLQSMGMLVNNFLAPANGLAIAMVLSRSISPNSKYNRIGNYYVDIVKSVLYVLLPLCIISALVLVYQGVPQSMMPKQYSVERSEPDIIKIGPIASMVAIKQIGNNGGGFFLANAKHPFESPTELSAVFQIILMLLLPGSLIVSYGYIIGNHRHSAMLFILMFIMLLIGSSILYNAELNKPKNMVGKEMRNGIELSSVWLNVATATATGSTNATMVHLDPISKLVMCCNLIFSNTIFGGVGTGLISIIFYNLFSVFMGSLMVGRTPEYLGKKIEPKEIRMVMIYILSMPIIVLVASGMHILYANFMPSANMSITKLIYAYLSTANNNGSMFEGANYNNIIINLLTSFAMIGGRYIPLIITIAIAGLLIEKKSIPATEGSLAVDSMQFMLLLFIMIVIIGGLSFFPLIALGPIKNI
jgi:K+-transporting ATPase ATPase A chain